MEIYFINGRFLNKEEIQHEIFSINQLYETYPLHESMICFLDENKPVHLSQEDFSWLWEKHIGSAFYLDAMLLAFMEDCGYEFCASPISTEDLRSVFSPTGFYFGTGKNSEESDKIAWELGYLVNEIMSYYMKNTHSIKDVTSFAALFCVAIARQLQKISDYNECFNRNSVTKLSDNLLSDLEDDSLLKVYKILF